MKNYTITVNGNVHDVTDEESGAGSPAARPAAAAPKAAPAAAPKAAAPAGGSGAIKLEAKAAGKVFAVEASVGQAVKKGDTVVILEVMKMETPVVAEADGTIASIDVAKGDSVEVGTVLATMN